MDYYGLQKNAAINIKNRAVGHPVLKVQEMSFTGVTEKPTLYALA
jgi:putative transposase